MSSSIMTLPTQDKSAETTVHPLQYLKRVAARLMVPPCIMISKPQCSFVACACHYSDGCCDDPHLDLSFWGSKYKFGDSSELIDKIFCDRVHAVY